MRASVRQMVLPVLLILLAPALSGCLDLVFKDDESQGTIRTDWTDSSKRFIIEFRTPENLADLTFAIYKFKDDRKGDVVDSISGSNFERLSATKYAATANAFNGEAGRYKLELFIKNARVAERAITVTTGHFLDVTGISAQGSYQVSHAYAAKVREGGDSLFLATGSLEEKSTNTTARAAYSGATTRFIIHTDDWVANVTARDIDLTRENGFIVRDALAYEGTWQTRLQFDTNGREQDGQGAIRSERTYVGAVTHSDPATGEPIPAYVTREWQTRSGHLRGPPPRALLEETLTYITKDARSGEVLAYASERWDNSTGARSTDVGTTDPRTYRDPFDALEFSGASPREIRLGDRFQKSDADGRVYQFEATKRSERPVMGRAHDVVQVDGRPLSGQGAQVLIYARTARETLNEPFPLTEGIIAEYRELVRAQREESAIEYRLASYAILT